MEPRLIANTRYQREYEREFALQENHPLPLVRAEGRHVECLSGIVWITAYDHSLDFILRPGQVFVVPNSGLTLLEAAIGSCRVRVEQPGSLGDNLAGICVAGLAKFIRALSAVPALTRMPGWMRSRN